MIHWIIKRFTCSKGMSYIGTHLTISLYLLVEALHVANMLYSHGYFYSVERLEPAVRDDGELYRFQVTISSIYLSSYMYCIYRHLIYGLHKILMIQTLNMVRSFTLSIILTLSSSLSSPLPLFPSLCLWCSCISSKASTKE